MSICSAGDAFLSSKNYANLIIDESVCQTGWFSRVSLDLASEIWDPPLEYQAEQSMQWDGNSMM